MFTSISKFGEQDKNPLDSILLSKHVSSKPSIDLSGYTLNKNVKLSKYEDNKTNSFQKIFGKI